MTTVGAGSERRAYRVHGRVQGVGFRWWTRATALELRLGGYVRNLPDGGVEVQAAGSPASLELLELQLRVGPSGARVDRVESMPVDPRARVSEFQIRMS